METDRNPCASLLTKFFFKNQLLKHSVELKLMESFEHFLGTTTIFSADLAICCDTSLGLSTIDSFFSKLHTTP